MTCVLDAKLPLDGKLEKIWKAVYTFLAGRLSHREV